MNATLHNLTKRLAKDERGNVLMTFGLCVIPAVLFVGSAIDFGNAYSSKQKIQRAADAAVLAAAAMGYGTTEAARKTMAVNVFNANVTGLSGVSAVASANGNAVSLVATAAHPTAFLRLAHIETINVGGSSTGSVSYSQGSTTETAAGKVCLLALDPGNEVKGIAASGTPSVSYADCWAHTNSTMVGGAIHGNGSGTVTGAGHTAVGTANSAATGIFSPTPAGGKSAISDPFATNVGGAYAASGYATTFTPPSYSSCTGGTGLKLQQGTYTLSPGKYCEGLQIMANATVTFLPGEYVIENGGFIMQSGAKASGTNVLFYLKQTNFSHNKYNTSFTIIGAGSNGLVNLKGRTSATSTSGLNGFLIIVSMDAGSGQTSNIQGGTTFLMEGMIYAPKQNIKITGGGTTAAATNGNTDMFALVAKSFEFDGNGQFYLKKRGTTTTLPDILPTNTYTYVPNTVISNVKID